MKAVQQIHRHLGYIQTNILSEKYMKDISKNIMLSDDDMVLDLEIFN